MNFASIPQDALLQASLGPATATVLGASGLRLNGLTSFHLDEGPDFAWLNIYRTLADARQLEITRAREPAEVARARQRPRREAPVVGRGEQRFAVDVAASALTTRARSRSSICICICACACA